MYKAIVFPYESTPVEKGGFQSKVEAFVWASKEHDYEDDVFVILDEVSNYTLMSGIFDGAEERFFPDIDLNEYFRRVYHE